MQTDQSNQTRGKPGPWSWIPSLYFASGLPNVVIMTVSVVMYKRPGLSNTDIALYTSWLYLPWLIQLLSPASLNPAFITGKDQPS